MITNLLTGLAIWMVASLGLGLLIGAVIRGYSVPEVPERRPLAGADSPSFPQAA